MVMGMGMGIGDGDGDEKRLDWLLRCEISDQT